MDLVMDYDLIRNMYLELGNQKFFDVFNKTYGEGKFYTMSTTWVDSKEYILKFKGSARDIIVSWQ